MKKLLILSLILIPVLTSAQKVMVWKSTINDVHFHIRLENSDKKHGPFEFMMDDLLTNPIDYYAWGKWRQINDSVYLCTVKTGNYLDMFPKKFILKRDTSFIYLKEEILYNGNYNLE